MAKGWGDDWRKWTPPTRDAGPAARPPAAPAPGKDRGSRRGAKRVVVTSDRQIVDAQLAKATNLEGLKFQSRREAVRFVDLLRLQDAGDISSLKRQVRFPLDTVTECGNRSTVCHYVADFTYTERGPVFVVEDVKPAGGHREDTYLLKRRWFHAQYGFQIRETS